MIQINSVHAYGMEYVWLALWKIIWLINFLLVFAFGKFTISVFK